MVPPLKYSIGRSMDFPVPRDLDVALFFERLFLLLNDPAKRNIIRWCEDGKKIVVCDDTRMQMEICPLLFQLCTWPNFLQTLYACRFRRVRRNWLEFSHEVFSQRRLQFLTRQERFELFRTELGYKASRLTNRGALPESWEEWLGTEICKRTITNAAGNVQVTIVTPGGESSTSTTTDAPRVRKSSLPRRHEGEDEIVDVEAVTSEESSGDLPASTPTTHRGSPSDSSTIISEQHPSDDESTRNDGGEDNRGEETTHHQTSANNDQGDDSTSNNGVSENGSDQESTNQDRDDHNQGQGDDNSEDESTNQGSSNHDSEAQGRGNDNSGEESNNQESSNNDGEGQDERSDNENSDEDQSDESTSSSDEESGDEATSENDEPGEEATSENDEPGEEAMSENDETGDEAASGNEEEPQDTIDKSPPVKTRRLRKPVTPSKCTRRFPPSVAGPSTSAATNEPSTASYEDSEKMKDQSAETTETSEQRERIIVRIPKKYLLTKKKRRRESDD